MLFAALYTTKNETEESQKRSLALFASWQPPFEFKAHYARVDGRGGVAVVEADDAAVLLEGIAPFTPFFDFDVTPLVEIEAAVPLFAKTNDWRDSIS